MSKLLSTVAVAAFLAAGASAAQAGVIFSSVAYDAAPSPGEVMVVDFDHPNAAGYSMTWSGAGLYQGPLVSGIAAPPYGELQQVSFRPYWGYRDPRGAGCHADYERLSGLDR